MLCDMNTVFSVHLWPKFNINLQKKKNKDLYLTVQTKVNKVLTMFVTMEKGNHFKSNATCPYGRI